jgi:hypothetical protein
MNTNKSAPKQSLTKRVAAALLMGGGIAIAGFGLASGTAQADPGPQDHQSHSSSYESHSWYSESDHQWYWCWFDFFNWCWHYSPYQP